MKVVPGTKCSSKIFRFKNKVFGQVQIYKKTSISWGLCTGTKCGKVVLFGFSTGTMSEILNFYSSNILNSKSTTFSHLVPVQRPQEIEEKNSEKVFFGYLYRSKYLIFGPKKFFEKCWCCIWYLVLPSKIFF